MKILIIEDELSAAKELERLLLRYEPSIEVVAIKDSVSSSISFLQSNPQLDLIFSDIQLADGMCFDIYKTVQIQSPIIFCTAFDEYMMEAFETNAVSYLLKPISMSKIQAAMEKFEQLKKLFRPEDNTRLIESLISNLKKNYKRTLLVNLREQIIPIPVDEIAYFYFQNKTIQITTFKNKQYSISPSLDELENVLDPEKFYRANRQFLIHKNSIKSIERFFMRKVVVELLISTPEAVVISKVKVNEFLRWMEGV
ncbi:LytR/AlgR family response regulator transcription factor [Rhizosphaericola mali]|uniref:Response regulator transcription factor n=1 Tax=Rhizosphaericola mali TaxID=2545455 RepID=A0A5P2FZE5_9BACT|nr:LytTR family DNA-binding domain-containing protein [Rhizosphaericola mali]QES88585.1 response regulator transcription factor [Rhizosphaericola mali]